MNEVNVDEHFLVRRVVEGGYIMNIAKMRSILAEVYTGASWKERVGTMSNEQVFAVYKRLERSGELYKHNRRTEHITPAFWDATGSPDSYITRDAQGRTVWITKGP